MNKNIFVISSSPRKAAILKHSQPVSPQAQTMKRKQWKEL